MLRWHHQDSIKVVTPTTTMPTCQSFSERSGSSFTEGPLRWGWGGQMLFQPLWNWSPESPDNLPLVFIMKKNVKSRVLMPAPNYHRTVTFPISQRAVWIRYSWLCERRELPLVEEKQHCIITWIFFFFYKCSIRREDGTFSPRYR